MVTVTKEQEQRALDDCRTMQKGAEEANMSRCVEGEAVFWYAWERGLIPGHIYSEAGRNEFRMSHSCEFHFDKWLGGKDESPKLWDEATKSCVGPIHGAK